MSKMGTEIMGSDSMKAVTAWIRTDCQPVTTANFNAHVSTSLKIIWALKISGARYPQCDEFP